MSRLRALWFFIRHYQLAARFIWRCTVWRTVPRTVEDWENMKLDPLFRKDIEEIEDKISRISL